MENDVEPDVTSIGGYPPAIEDRIGRSLVALAAIVPLLSLPARSLSITGGLFIGGVLAVVNFRWLRSFSRAAVGGKRSEGKAALNGFKFLLRLLLIGAAIYFSTLTPFISTAYLIAGMCTIVVAILFEAAREMFLMIKHRELT